MKRRGCKSSIFTSLALMLGRPFWDQGPNCSDSTVPDIEAAPGASIWMRSRPPCLSCVTIRSIGIMQIMRKIHGFDAGFLEATLSSRVRNDSSLDSDGLLVNIGSRSSSSRSSIGVSVSSSIRTALGGERAAYGNRLSPHCRDNRWPSTVAATPTKNLRRMTQFAEAFPRVADSSRLHRWRPCRTCTSRNSDGELADARAALSAKLAAILSRSSVCLVTGRSRRRGDILAPSRSWR